MSRGFDIELTITVKDGGETFTHTESKYVVPSDPDDLYGEDLRHAVVTAYTEFLEYDLAHHMTRYLEAKRHAQGKQIAVADMKKILENIYDQ